MFLTSGIHLIQENRAVQGNIGHGKPSEHSVVEATPFGRNLIQRHYKKLVGLFWSKELKKNSHVRKTKASCR